MSFTDTGLTPGQTYRYRLRAIDSNGNAVLSDFVSITMPTSVDPYVTAVIDDNASNYWRLNSSGTTQLDYAGSLNQTNAGTTTGTGALTGDNALVFPGTTSGQSGTTSSITGPTTFTAEAWFKTTTTSGGKIVGFGGSSTGNSGSYDRHVYMDNSGRITFGVYPGGVQTVRSANSYNDGQWHHVVASLSSGGMQLYLDGLRVGANASVTSAQEYSGFWRIGGDNLNGWTNIPSSFYFNGSIDEVAIYPTALSGAQIRDHYTKSGRTLAIPPAPTDAYGQVVYNDDPALYWRLNEASGSTAADVSPNMSNGTYQGGVSYRPQARCPIRRTRRRSTASTASSARNNQFSNPMNYSEEIWFKTTSTCGGKLIGFGCSPDRHLGLLRPAHLHGQRRPGHLRRLDRVHQHDHHDQRAQRRQVAPRGRHPELDHRDEAVHRRRSGRHQRPDLGPGLRRLLAGRWRQPLGLLQPLPGRRPGRGGGLRRRC